jgi:photosystem II stability/assembly factor-like uncharacterized protein
MASPGKLLACLAFLSASVVSAQRWESHGPYGGTFEAIAFDPSAPGSVYGGNRAGIFESDDHGATWSARSCDLGDTIVFSLAVEPRFVDPTPPPTVFAATAGGLYRSGDAGGTWNRLSAGLPDGGFFSVAVDLDATRVFAGGSAIFRSLDGGDHWQPASTVICSGTEADRVQGILALDGAVLAATSCGVYRSDDGGDHWILVEAGGASNQAVSLAGAPESSTVIAGFFADSVRRSSDGGIGWAVVDDGLPSPPDLQTLVATDPRHPEVVYAGGWASGVFRSPDGGATWTAASTGLGNLRILAISVDPFSSSILAATGDRLYRSDDGAATWSFSDAGLRGTSIGSVALAGSHVYAGAFERGDALFPVLFDSADEGGHWGAGGSPLPFADPLASVFAVESAPSIVYATSAELARLARSEDGGATWLSLDSELPPSLVACGGGQGCAVGLVVASDGTLYAGGSGEIFRSVDRGDSWSPLDLPAPAGLLAVDPQRPLHLYAASADAGGSHLLLSEDGGVTWRLLGTTPDAIFSLAFDPLDADVLYGIDVVDRGIVRSVDGGMSWAKVGFAGPPGFLPAQVVAGRGALYVPTDEGVYRSTDRGTTWAPFGDCLASPRVLDAAVDELHGFLYAATNGGVFRIETRSDERGRVAAPPAAVALPVRRGPV